MLFITMILVFMMLYILARLSFFYINVWALSLFFVTLLLISYSAGRNLVEHKLL
jgi:hypothetical protein